MIPRGGVRDPQVHYDGKKILFSYRKGGTEQYHLYEINADGTGLRQLTDGTYDDIEPTYLPDGDIVFVSTRCKRWVNCWLTQVAIMHRCDADGQNIRPISSNNEQDNTPWPLPDGRMLYTRWEYVDRSQVHYHHLWTANPDGTAQMIWYGNLHPGTVMIDAKPIPGSDKVVASFSPGHGQREHAGAITVVDPQRRPGRAGVRPAGSAAAISSATRGRSRRTASWRRSGPTLVVMDGNGAAAEDLHAARRRPRGRHATARAPPARRRGPASAIIPDRVDPGEATGRLVLAEHLQRPQHGRREARRDQEAPRARNAAHADPLHRRHGADQLRRHVHPRAHRRHRAGRGRRLGLLRTARPAQLLLRRAGRERPVRQAHAELPDRAAGRDDQLRRLPRAAHPDAGQLPRGPDGSRPCAVRPAGSSRSPTCPT